MEVGGSPASASLLLPRTRLGRARLDYLIYGVGRGRRRDAVPRVSQVYRAPRGAGLLHGAVVPGEEGDRQPTGARALVLDLALDPLASQVVDEALGNLSAEVVLLAPDPALAGELGSRGAFDPERDFLAGACASSVTFLHFLVPLSFGLFRLFFCACDLLRGVLLLGGLVLRLLVPTATRREDGRSQEHDD